MKWMCPNDYDLREDFDGCEKCEFHGLCLYEISTKKRIEMKID